MALSIGFRLWPGKSPGGPSGLLFGTSKTLNALLRQKLASARELTLAEVDKRSLPVRLRDGIARLWAPYL
jgi:hypothetical protein